MKPNPFTQATIKTWWKPHGRSHPPTLTPDQRILKDKRKTHENTLEDDLIRLGMAPVAKTLHTLDRDVFQKTPRVAHPTQPPVPLLCSLRSKVQVNPLGSHSP